MSAVAVELPCGNMYTKQGMYVPNSGNYVPRYFVQNPKSLKVNESFHSVLLHSQAIVNELLLILTFLFLRNKNTSSCSCAKVKYFAASVK